MLYHASPSNAESGTDDKAGRKPTTNRAARAATAVIRPAARRTLVGRLNGRRSCGGTIG